MEKFTTYSDKELQANFRWLNSVYNSMNGYIKMMEEQGENKRDNLDWKSTSGTLRKSLTDLQTCLNDFKVLKIEEYNK